MNNEETIIILSSEAKIAGHASSCLYELHRRYNYGGANAAPTKGFKFTIHLITDPNKITKELFSKVGSTNIFIESSNSKITSNTFKLMSKIMENIDPEDEDKVVFTCL